MSVHNSTSGNLATVLEGLNPQIAIITSDLKGVIHGGVRMNDARVQDVIMTSFIYTDIMQQDLNLLQGVTPADLLALEAKGFTAYQGKKVVPVTLSDFEDALKELIDSRTLSVQGKNTATHDAVFDPLEVDGFIVPSARVYVGSQAEPKGTIYLQGLRIGRKVLAPPPNGYKPAAKSRPLTVAKEALSQSLGLPSNNYVSYILRPDTTGWVLKVGSKTVKPSMTPNSDVVVS